MGERTTGWISYSRCFRKRCALNSCWKACTDTAVQRNGGRPFQIQGQEKEKELSSLRRTIIRSDKKVQKFPDSSHIGAMKVTKRSFQTPHINADLFPDSPQFQMKRGKKGGGMEHNTQVPRLTTATDGSSLVIFIRPGKGQ